MHRTNEVSKREIEIERMGKVGEKGAEKVEDRFKKKGKTINL